MEEYVCIVPRNLNKPDTIIHSPIELNWKQIGYIGLGLCGAYLGFKMDSSILIKLVTITGSCGLGILSAMYNYKGSSVDELAFDAITYAQRKIYYSNLEKRGDFIVTIGSKDEDATVKIERKKLTVLFSNQ